MIEKFMEIGDLLLKTDRKYLLQAGLRTVFSPRALIKVDKKGNKKNVLKAIVSLNFDAGNNEFEILIDRSISEAEEYKDIENKITNLNILLLPQPNSKTYMFLHGTKFEHVKNLTDFSSGKLLLNYMEKVEINAAKEDFKKINRFLTWDYLIKEEYLEKFYQKLKNTQLDNFEVGVLFNIFTNFNEKMKKLDIVKKIIDYLKQLQGKDKVINPREDRVLIFIAVDGENIASKSYYLDLIRYALVSKEYSKKNKKGKCIFCEKEEKLMIAPTTCKIRLLSTDKPNFYWNYDNEKADFGICKDCFLKIYFGEKLLYAYKTTLLGKTIMFLPNFKADIKMIKDFVGRMDKIINFSKNKKNDLEDFSKQLDSMVKKLQEIPFLDIVFYKENQQEFKIANVIKHINPGNIRVYLEILRKVIRDLNSKFLFFANTQVKYSKFLFFDRLLAKVKGEYISKEIFELLESIFTRSLFNKSVLQKILNENLIYSMKKDIQKSKQYHIEAKYENFSLIGEMLKIVLNKYGILETKEAINLETILNDLKERIVLWDEQLPEKIEILAKEGNWKGEELVLVALGFEVGKVAKKQFAEFGKSPILDTLTSVGLPVSKVPSLINLVFEKLRVYSIFSTKDEKVLSFVLNWFERLKNKWSFNSSTNLYYLMLGYSLFSSERNKKEKEENKEGLTDDNR